MASYRLYRLGYDNHILLGAGLEAANDVVAVEAAKGYLGECPLELWQGARLVARLPGVPALGAGPPIPWGQAATPSRRTGNGGPDEVSFLLASKPRQLG